MKFSSKPLYLPLLFLILVVLTPQSVSAISAKDANYEIGASLGNWFSGDISIGSGDYEKDSSLLLRAFADMYVTPKFAVGAYFNYSSVTVGGVDGSASEFGLALKPRLFLSDAITIKPGLNIGYRGMSSDNANGEADGFAANLSIELQYHIGTGLVPFVEFGFLAQPAGGNEYVDITWAPIGYISIGLAYAF
jgi:hypothetical protein